MSTKELIDSAVEHLHTSASVKTVYGEPVVIDGKTIIPVAKVAYGFGGGAGTRKKQVATTEAGKEPAAAETREGAGVGTGLGFLLGLVLGRRRD